MRRATRGGFEYSHSSSIISDSTTLGQTWVYYKPSDLNTGQLGHLGSKDYGYNHTITTTTRTSTNATTYHYHHYYHYSKISVPSICCKTAPSSPENNLLNITYRKLQGGDGRLSVYPRFCKAFSRWRQRHLLLVLARPYTSFEKQSTILSWLRVPASPSPLTERLHRSRVHRNNTLTDRENTGCLPVSRRTGCRLRLGKSPGPPSRVFLVRVQAKTIVTSKNLPIVAVLMQVVLR